MISAGEMARPLAAAADELVDTPVPEGFARLETSAIQAVVWHLQTRRTLLAPGEAPIPLCYRPSGAFVAALAAIDTLYLGTGHEPPDPRTLATTPLIGFPYPVSGGQYRGRPSIDDVLRLAQDDTYYLARWFADTGGRTWQAGTPHPPALLAPVLEALSGRPSGR